MLTSVASGEAGAACGSAALPARAARTKKPERGRDSIRPRDSSRS